jgi:hypothetical protein
MGAPHPTRSETKSFSLALPDWQYKKFAEIFSHGPLSRIYFPSLDAIWDTSTEDGRRRDEDRQRRITETYLRPLAEACGQDDPDWKEFQAWYGHLWRLEGSTFSAVLPFPGRFLVVIGRDDATDPETRPLAGPIESHVVEIDANQSDTPTFTLHNRD